MAVIRTQNATLASSGPALEVKGTIAPVTVLCLRSTELDRIEQELRARVEPAPQMFRDAPIVIDLADVEGELESLSLSGVMEVVRRCRLIPIGVAHLPADRLGWAAEVGLPILQLGFGRTRGARAASSVAPMPSAPAPVPAPVARPMIEPRPASEAPPPTLTISQPVRGGQVLYAKDTDLVVHAQVNPGAQVIADGHVHVYGRLRGRALAGARGLTEARVFCQSLEAELVSIAGEFLTADDIPAEMRGRPAQIFLEHGELRVSAL